MSSSAERSGAIPGTAHRVESERGRSIMAEVSWLSDYVSANDGSAQGAGHGLGRVSPNTNALGLAGQGFAGQGLAGQGIAGLMGIGLEADAQSWQEQALCAETDPEAFFPEKGGSTREAKEICTGCEVKAQCLASALSTT